MTAAIDVFNLTDDDLDAIRPARKPVADPAPRARVGGTNGGYGIGRPRFSRADIQDILAASARGESGASIARRYGCTPSSIQYQLKRHLAHLDPVEVTRTRCPRCGIDSASGLCADCWDVLGDLGELRQWRSA